MKILKATIALLLAAAPASGQIFHRPEIDYGSASIRNPLETMANRGFSVLVFDWNERRLGKIGWEAGWESVRGALTNPKAAVDRRGTFLEFLSGELFPPGQHVLDWAFLPNYSGHILAGGITYRQYAEWLADQRVPLPRTTAAAWYMATMVLNEIVENPHGGPGDPSTVADLYIFDPLAILLFSHDGIARWWGGTALAADWSPQAAITLPDARVQNAGQVMSYKIPLPGTDRLRVLVLVAMGGAAGLRYAVDDEYHVGAALGFDGKERTVEGGSGAESITVRTGGGLYLDRNNSLLVSAVWSQRDYSRLQINVYPGVLPGVLRDAGVWATRTASGAWSAGVSLRRGLPIAVGWDGRR